VFSADIRAVASGTVQFSGNQADDNKTLVFSLAGGAGFDTEVPTSLIGFIDPPPLNIAAAPIVERLTVESLLITGPAELRVAAEGVRGGDGGVEGVVFYRDTNGNREWDLDDAVLGIDEDPHDGWNWRANTGDWSLGPQTLFARTWNSLGQWSEATGARLTYSSWQYPDKPVDVDGNGEVRSLDALVLINQINRGPHAALPPRSNENLHWPFYDVSGDGYLTPLDVLLVIQYLNVSSLPPSVPAVSAEGESAAAKGPDGQTLSRRDFPGAHRWGAAWDGRFPIAAYRTPSPAAVHPRRLPDPQDLWDDESPLLEWEDLRSRQRQR